MKLAEALLLRGDMQKSLASLRERIIRAALVQEGSTPQEDANALLAEASALVDELATLVTAINTANLTRTLGDGRTLTAAIAERDALASRHSLLTAALNATQRQPELYSAREIRWIPTVDVGALHAQSSEISRRIRELNVSIQQANWTAEL